MNTSCRRLGHTQLLRRHPPLLPSFHPSPKRPFMHCTSQSLKPLPQRPTLPDADLHHVFLKGSGPGGQKINKTNSAVQLTHKPTGIVVKSQATRSRSQNYKIVRQILAEKIELLEKGDQSRLAKKIERKSAKKRSREKKARRKYKGLDEARLGRGDDGGMRQEDEDGVEVEDKAGDAVEEIRDVREQSGKRV